MDGKRVAIVTGANRGIGLEIARQLAKAGYKVMAGARDPVKVVSAFAADVAAGRDVSPLMLDVDRQDSIDAAVADVLSRQGRIDVLVNNAAILIDEGGFTGSLAPLERDVMLATYTTNVIGPTRLIQAVMAPMHKAGYGRIVNLSSGAGQLSEMGMGFPAYRMSKTALNALTRIAARELAEHGVKVNAMCPGWVRTGMGGPNAPREAREAADTAVWLATLPADGPTGGIFRDRKPIAW